MHEPAAGAELRQGDVCAIPSIPIWNLTKSHDVSGSMLEGILLPNWDRTAQLDDKYLVTVCTQCCDLENPRARTGVALAPLMKVPASRDSEQHERILNSSRPDLFGRYEWVNLFPMRLPSDPADTLVADFSAIITMASMKVAVPRLLASRRFSLNDDERIAFREKLGFMFGRDPDAKAPTDLS